MNNFMVRANGTARVTITDPRVNLGSNADTSARAGTGPQPDTNSIQLPTIKIITKLRTGCYQFP